MMDVAYHVILLMLSFAGALDQRHAGFVAVDVQKDTANLELVDESPRRLGGSVAIFRIAAMRDEVD